MDSFEINKIIGAVLGTLLFVMGAGLVAEAIYHPIQNSGPGYALPEPVTGEGGEVVAEVVLDLGTLLASASAENGQNVAAKCASCHSLEEGGPNKTGPHLYDVVMRPEGSVPDFAYSDAMAAHHAAGDVWTYENLDHFLTKPQDYAPGTKMGFSGLPSPKDRADLLAYLQTLSADPKPFPAPAPATAEGEAAPAEAAPATEIPPAEGATTPTDPATTAPANEAAPTAPAAVTDTPTTTPSETPVEGTPTTSGTPAATQPAAPAETPAAPAPAAPAAPATTPAPAAPAPATDPAPTGSIGGSSVGISINAQAMPQPIAQ